ncbi:MAG: RluA family pseudouridine synthase [Desulfobulbus propionicus]|nr:MAG: RluA family pseudouridine synthase [Desulfobulbus propionicus]
MISHCSRSPSFDITPGKTYTLRVAPTEEKQRLDHFLARQYGGLTRSYFLKLIQGGQITVSGRSVKAGYKIHAGDNISVVFPEPEKTSLFPEQVPYEILFEDEHLVVISKPPGVVVHPAAGNLTGTLVHGLLHRYQNLPQLEEGRPGIVHRLDKDTSGIMLVAKTGVALRQLAQDFQNRRIDKTYQAIMLRSPEREAGRIVAAIGRHPVNRKKMAIRENTGKYAATSWIVEEKFSCGLCRAKIHIETGRTHQIRVHMASLKAPVAGDELYGGKHNKRTIPEFPRQMLHAWSLEFQHPVEQNTLHIVAPVWPDMAGILEYLRSEDS